MRITGFSDLAFRVLLFAEAHQEELFTIDEMIQYYSVSRGHLMKVVNTLTKGGFLVATRGRSGGLSLGKAPETINLSDVLLCTETDFKLVECMRSGNQCVLAQNCKLPDPLEEAMNSFLQTLAKYTLADIAWDRSRVK